MLVPGKGKMTITGKLGDVMQESVQAAKSSVRSRSRRLGIAPRALREHRHPYPCAGGRHPERWALRRCRDGDLHRLRADRIPVKAGVAMTGEVTLRGRVLPIGGLKEKLLAALRGGIKTVLIPKENEKDLAEIPDNVKKGLRIIPVANADEVLQMALATLPEPLAEPAIGPEIAAKTAPPGDAARLPN